MKSGKNRSHRLLHVALSLTGLFPGFMLAGLRTSGAEVAATNGSALTVSSTAAPAEPPVHWIDPDTGHRVIRLTREPGSDSFYFNHNSYTPDGISVLNLQTLSATQLATRPARTNIVGRKTPNLYYTRATDDRLFRTLWRVNLDTGENRKIADLPRRANVTPINADETLGAGTCIEGDANAAGAYDGTTPYGWMSSTNLGEPANKGEVMTRRLEARLPMTLFTVDLRTGETKTLLQHDTNWLNHLQFSPTDPTLLLYCHKGHWQLVNRIWTIRTDSTQNQLIHRRIMEMEIAGHEWWGATATRFSISSIFRVADGTPSSPATTSGPRSASGCNMMHAINRPSTTTPHPTADSSAAMATPAILGSLFSAP